MTNISRGAGERIGRSVRKTERADDNATDEVQPANSPIIIVRTQEAITRGTVGDVKRLVRPEDDSEKGDEVEIGEAFEAYNRLEDLDTGQECHARWIDGGWELISSVGATVSATGCGSCQTVAETLTVPITGGLNAAATYLFIALCGGEPFTLEFGSGSTWNGDGTQSTTCNGGSVTVTLTMTISGYLPGDVVIAATGDPGSGTVTLAQWENETAFQPGTNTVMRLVAGDLSCLCSPFEPFPCLIPVEPEA